MEHDFAYYLHQAWEVLKFIGLLIVAILFSMWASSQRNNHRRRY